MLVVAVLAGIVAICCWPSARPVDEAWCAPRRDLHAFPAVRRRRGSSVRSAQVVARAERGRLRRTPTATRVDPPEVAVTMDLLALVAASGRGVLEAMDRVASVSPQHVRTDLATVVAAQGWGVRARDAWLLVGPAWDPVASALTLASTAGLAPSGILVRAASDIRSAHAEALELSAARLGVRLVLPLGLAFLPAFVLLTVVPLVVALATQLLG
ncbi:MAG: type II secretion system F family protein [Dermatophilaceae bacterium]